jgi:hypothetical protein
MGEAFCAVANDAHAIYYNPAGLADVPHYEIPLSNNSWFQGINQQSIGIAYNLHDVRTENLEELGTIAFSMNTLDYGDLKGMNAAGVSTGDFDAEDQVMTLSYGRALLDLPETGRILAGLSGRMITQDIDSKKWTHYTFDAGALWRLPGNPFSLGLALQNFGGKLGYEDESFDAPLNLKAGAAYHPANDLTLAADVNSPANADLYFAIGGEYNLMNTLALRLGYNTRSDQGMGLTAGFGVMLKQVDIEFMYFREIDIDYAFVPYGDLGDAHRVTLNLKFGAD